MRLLDALIADIGVDVTEAALLGSGRDLKVMLAQADAQIRSVERASDAQVIRAFVPREALSMVVVDLARQQASGNIDAMLVDRAQAARILASSGVTITYLADAPTGADSFVTNSDSQNLADFPDTMEIPIIPDGAGFFADGGELSLGWINDSVMNATNDQELFAESFEAVGWRGPFGLTATLTSCPNGYSQAASDETGSVCSGS